MPNTQIKKDGKILIDLAKVEKNIEDMKEKAGYQICYHFDDFNKFVYQKMEEVEKFNFEDEYKNHCELVDNLYSIYNRILENKDKNEVKDLISNFRSIYNDNCFALKHIIEKKYVYGKKILEEDLNKNCYFEFIFKILSLMLFNENFSEFLENYGIDGLKDKYEKLLENKKKLDEDILLKIYEKIFLLIEAYSLELLYKDDHLIHYYHINNIEKNSPLFYAYEFLTKFIEELNYDSSLYYPLLSIDAGLYINYFKKKVGSEPISAYGFNMLSMNTLKEHLKNMIPNYIILLKFEGEDNARTNPLNGNVILNMNYFENIDIGKEGLDENISRHFAFVISKNLIHEIFGHKKSSYSKSVKNYDSIILFTDENGELKFIDKNDDNGDIFKDIDEIYNGKASNNYKGDSGYFIEYFLGKINNEYTLCVIDMIEKKTNLAKLLDTKFWHKEISTFKEYIKYKSVYYKYINEDEDFSKISILDEIQLIKKRLIEKNIKIEVDALNDEVEDTNELTKKVDKLFDNIWKNRKNIIKDEKKNGTEKKKNIFI